MAALRSAEGSHDEMPCVAAAQAEVRAADLDLEQVADVHAPHEPHSCSGQQAEFHQPTTEGPLASYFEEGGAFTGGEIG